jgi:AraC-like DNA-binding protein
MKEYFKLYIKNMVCDRCKLVVRQEFEKIGVEPVEVRLGEVDLTAHPDAPTIEIIRQCLQKLGFELLDDKKEKLIEQIKNIVIQLIHHDSSPGSDINLSEYIAGKLNRDYNFLSHLFSSTEGITLEKYIILQKVEKVKELLVYDELTLSEIAWQLGYSSVQHLSAQFKKITGLTPSHFKEIKAEKRKSLDKI